MICGHGRHASIGGGAGPIRVAYCRTCSGWRVLSGRAEHAGQGADAYRELIASLATGADRAFLLRLPAKGWRA